MFRTSNRTQLEHALEAHERSIGVFIGARLALAKSTLAERPLARDEEDVVAQMARTAIGMLSTFLDVAAHVFSAPHATSLVSALATDEASDATTLAALELALSGARCRLSALAAMTSTPAWWAHAWPRSRPDGGAARLFVSRCYTNFLVAPLDEARVVHVRELLERFVRQGIELWCGPVDRCGSFAMRCAAFHVIGSLFKSSDSDDNDATDANACIETILVAYAALVATSHNSSGNSIAVGGAARCA